MSQCMLCYKDRCAVKLFEIPSIPIAEHIGHSQLRNILLFIHVHDVVMGGVPPLEQSRAVTLYTLYSDSVYYAAVYATLDVSFTMWYSYNIDIMCFYVNIIMFTSRHAFVRIVYYYY